MRSFDERQFVILAIFLLLGLVYSFRLFYIQVIDESYISSAENQALRYVTQYPARGTIYDRNGKLLVYNEAAYDLMVVPKKVKEMDTLAFCELIGITKESFDKKLKKAKKYSRHKASVFEKQIVAKAYASISEKLYQYPGFYGQKRTLRKYPASIASHVLGYVGEVGPSVLKKDTYYKQGDYIGINGIEKSYEKELRGERGVQILMVDVHNTVKGSYRNGALDTLASPGKDLISTLDATLQAYGERLMQNKKGSIVAIEPSTGEILTLVSSPTYDPNLLVGRERGENYQELKSNDSLNPLFNRATNARYRPGSIFKMIQALIALEEGVITPQTRVVCNRSIINCHGAHTNDDLAGAIQHSCNPYFHQVYKRLIQRGKFKSRFKDSEHGLREWRKHVVSFGFGNRFDTDITELGKGLIPDVNFYNKWYGEGGWAFSTIYSNSIGEGELGVVPIQMANLACIIANKGYYYTPHLVKGIGENKEKRADFLEKQHTTINPKHFEVVINAMQTVINEPGGTASRARLDSIIVCGKTGTVQNEGKPDHSVFIAFAPKKDPKIAIAVYVENAGFGGTWAAPIASLMIEQYLTDSISKPEKEQRILEADFISGYDQQ